MHEEMYGEFGISDNHDIQLLQEASILTEFELKQLVRKDNLTTGLKMGDNSGSNTYYIENEEDLEFIE